MNSHYSQHRTRGFTIDGLMDTLKGNYAPRVAKYLQSVYALMGVSLLFTAVGSYVAVKGSFMAESFLGGFIALLCILGITFMSPTAENLKTRIGLLFAASFFMGHGMWPLLVAAIQVDPTIIMTCLLGTAVVFVAFSLGALTARPGSYLFLGHSILYVMSWVSLTILTQLLVGFPGRWVFTVYPYVSLAIALAFVLYDTQMIAARCSLGYRDVVLDAAMLLIDFIEIFRFLVAIMTSNKKKEKREN